MAEIAPTDHLVGKVWEENAFGQSPQFVTMFLERTSQKAQKGISSSTTVDSWGWIFRDLEGHWFFRRYTTKYSIRFSFSNPLLLKMTADHPGYS